LHVTQQLAKDVGIFNKISDKLRKWPDLVEQLPVGPADTILYKIPIIVKTYNCHVGERIGEQRLVMAEPEQRIIAPFEGQVITLINADHTGFFR